AHHTGCVFHLNSPPAHGPYLRAGVTHFSRRGHAGYKNVPGQETGVLRTRDACDSGITEWSHPFPTLEDPPDRPATNRPAGGNRVMLAHTGISQAHSIRP